MNTPDHPSKNPKSKRPSADHAALAAEAFFGKPIEKITAPGGRERASVRIHFQDRQIIASWRADPKRRLREIRILEYLSQAEADVPTLLGVHDGWTFQSDVGSRRLTSALLRRSGAHRDDLAVAAIESLVRIKQTIQKDFLRDTPSIATSPAWALRFASGPRHLGHALDAPAPEIDENALAHSILDLPVEFVKWDARPGNAAVSDDGRIIWFDWEDYGRRIGMEDTAFLVADEFWPFTADKSVELLEQTGVLKQQNRSVFFRFAALQAIQRCLLIIDQQQKFGWYDAERARRYDRIGVSQELLANCMKNAEFFAAQDQSTQSLTPWLARLSTSSKML